MSDTSTETHVSKEELEQHKKELAEHKKELEEHLSKWESYKNELKDELAKTHAEDVKEREELRVQLAQANEYIEKLKKAEAERDKVTASSSTMVLPPNDLPPQQPNVPENRTDASPGGNQPRKRSWKDGW